MYDGWDDDDWDDDDDFIPTSCEDWLQIGCYCILLLIIVIPLLCSGLIF